MTRIAIPVVEDGDKITAASINSRLTPFTQVGTLDAANVRSAGVDLAQFSSTRFMAPKIAHTSIGYNRYKHDLFNTVSGQQTGATPHIVSDSGGTPTVLSLGATGFSLTTSDILRVYWDLSVRSLWPVGVREWLNANLVQQFKEFDGTTNIRVSNGHACWAFWLQWDVTSAALTNFVNTPTQGSFNTVVVGTRGGNLLSNCDSTSVQCALEEYPGNLSSGQFTTFSRPGGGDAGCNWTGVDGAWHFAPSSPLTVYGLRVVFTGVLGAYNNGTANYLVRCDNIYDKVTLDYNGGQLGALLMRKS